MKRVAKIILYIFLGLVLLLVLWWVGSAAYSGWTGYKWEKQTEKFQMALSKPYREDTYGGKTPEETWMMFLEALKKEDVELASKYIVPEKREKRFEDLKKAKAEGRIPGILKNFSIPLQKEVSNSGITEQETARFFIPIKREGETLPEAYSIVLILNPYTKVWKISLL